MAQHGFLFLNDKEYIMATPTISSADCVGISLLNPNTGRAGLICSFASAKGRGFSSEALFIPVERLFLGDFD